MITGCEGRDGYGIGRTTRRANQVGETLGAAEKLSGGRLGGGWQKKPHVELAGLAGFPANFEPPDTSLHWQALEARFDHDKELVVAIRVYTGGGVAISARSFWSK